MNKNGLLIILLVILFVPACATKKPQFIEVKPGNESQAVIYIYRPNSAANIFVSPDIIITGKKRHKVENNSYFYVLLSQRKTVLKLDLASRYSGIKQQVINTEAGKTYYIRVSTSLKFEKNKPFSRSFEIQQVTKEIAINEMSKTKYTGDKVDSAEVNKDTGHNIQNKSDKEQFSISKTRNPFSK